MINQMTYNFKIKRSGKHVTMKKYSKNNYFNYEDQGNKNIGARGESEKKTPKLHQIHKQSQTKSL